ncbi:MAG: hypothetical protein FWF59_08790 [Turicibacter sp.]|nr:hypothetical protein [Turicibacter sp.]
MRENIIWELIQKFKSSELTLEKVEEMLTPAEYKKFEMTTNQIHTGRSWEYW